MSGMILVRMTTQRDSLAARIEHLAVGEGRTETAVPGLTVFRTTSPVGPFAVEYQPCLCVVGQGRKAATVGAQTCEYDPDQYLVVALPLPVSARIIEASRERPFLSMVLAIDVAELGQLLMAMPDEPEPEPERSPSTAMWVSSIEPRLRDAVLRLLRAAEDPTEARVLGPGIVREILFHVLGGDQGALLRSLALRNGHGQRVVRAIRFMQDHYEQALDVATIAKSVGVSASRLQHVFKDVTGLSPIQYLKRVRLHRAHVMILTEGLGAGEAAFRVGYGSPSQFSREFKRQFGLSPSHAVREQQGTTA